MGEKKSALMECDRYGLLKAAELAAYMIARYECAEPCALEMRVEVRNKPSWDDIYVRHHDRHERWQVKRQLEPLKKSKLEELIKNAIKEISESTGAPDASEAITLHFGFARFLPIGPTKSPHFDWEQFKNLCAKASHPGVVPEDFAQTWCARPEYKFVAQCHIDATPGAIVAILKRFHIEELGLEGDLRKRAANHLRDVFTNPEDVVGRIHDWFCQHPDGIIKIDVNLLYQQVVETTAKRMLGKSQWIYLRREPGTSQWNCEGPLPLSAVVETILKRKAPVSVRVHAEPHKGDLASRSLARLFLHYSTPCLTSVSTQWKWQTFAECLCGGTLGMTDAWTAPVLSDLDERHAYPPREVFTEDDIAKRLHGRMDELLWDKYIEAVQQNLKDREIESDLRQQMQALWAAWLPKLNATPRRAAFLESMLATVEEGRRDGFDVRLRNGPSACDELARATTNVLAIAAAFEAAGRPTIPKPINSEQTMSLGEFPAHVLALTCASHPKTRRPYRFCGDPEATLADERGITILATVEADPKAFHSYAAAARSPFHVVDAPSPPYNHQDPPCPVLTAGLDFSAAIKKGLPALRQHLRAVFHGIADPRFNALAAALSEV